MQETEVIENWKDVVGYEGYFQVSDLGRVMRIVGGKGTYAGKILKGDLSRGYPVVRLCINKSKILHFVHRLVARAFIGPCPDGMEVNHKDGITWNCFLANLEYVTRSENVKHAVDHGLRPRKTILTLEQAAEIKSKYSVNRTISTEKIGKKYGVGRGAIRGILEDKTWIR